MLKNEKATLPLKKEARVHVCGLRADNMGVQCGGWSVGWRGRRGAITPGTTIRQAIEKVVGAANITYSENAAGADKADVVVAVVGEDPYAEGSGDRAKLELGAQDLALLAAAKQAGKPLVVVLISGRPLILGDVLTAADAFVAAWLPGTEGDGVADVLYGAFKPTGKLSFSWPKEMSQIPINDGDRARRAAVPVRVRSELVSWKALAIATVTAVTASASASASAAPTGRELNSGWSFRKVAHAGKPDEAWLPATVPGCVHTDLLAAGKIGDPFFRLNEKDQQWIENEAWEYRTTVAVDAATLARDRVELVFAGLDTYADVSVNGVSVLTADNMFRSWRADVKSRLKAGDNVIVVRFASPIAKVKPAYDALGYKLPAANDQAKEMVSMWTRKAPYHYGWDWGPRFVTAGIWRPVTLEAWDVARLDDVQIFQTKLDAGAADLGVVARVVAARPGRARVTIAVAGGPVLGEANTTLIAGANDLKLGARIIKPELWWPAGLGAQKLYTLEAKLTVDGAPRGERRTRIGLRTVEVVHERDKTKARTASRSSSRSTARPCS